MMSPEGHKDLGLLILRVGVGLSFMAHGLPKLLEGPPRWASLGKAMGNFGIHFAPEAFGFLAMAAELFGGACLVLGFAARPAAAAMAFTMLVASVKHLSQGDTFAKSSHAIELCAVFLALMMIGPGAYRVRLGR
jgi:putative oxidoreductase